MNSVRLLVIACQVVFPGFASYDLFTIFNNLYGFIPAVQFTICYIFYILFHIFLGERLSLIKRRVIILSKIIFLLILETNAYFVFGFNFRFLIFSIMLVLVEMILYVAENNEQ